MGKHSAAGAEGPPVRCGHPRRVRLAQVAERLGEEGQMLTARSDVVQIPQQGRRREWLGLRFRWPRYARRSLPGIDSFGRVPAVQIVLDYVEAPVTAAPPRLALV